MAQRTSFDVVIVGGGHNALVAATILARAGRSVLVLERRDEVGGAAVSASPFPGVDARLSRYSYLVSLFPPALARMLGLSVELRRRRVAAYPPLPESAAWQSMLARVAERVFPTLLEPLRSREEMRRLIDDDATWAALLETPLSDALERTFDSDVDRGTVLTDALIGTFAAADDPQLRQNRCFLYHVVGGSWNVPVGGMGALSAALAGAALGAGAELTVDADVVSIATDERSAEVTCADGRRYGARHVLGGVAPAVLAALLGESSRTGERPPEGAQLKINMLLSRLPRLPDASVSPADAFTGTFHVNQGYEQLAHAYRQASAGEIPALPPCEVYCHSLTDPSILSAELRARGVHTMTLFGLHMPARLFAADAAARKLEAVEATLGSIDSVLAEPLEDCLLRAPDGTPCLESLTPPELEAELGMPGGHIFHRDLTWPFAESEEDLDPVRPRWGVETAHANVWVCGAGARRGGGVSGIPGHNAARAVLEARGR
ncbi:MAG TPA: NAD(P)/FAD-dependent oxidoreductase [Solirubrobacteraceae bacterium]|nr:NAD(P)/FAD-dependent oxidoreductase [Solirubrobacteraceae bacterium]